jgi:hypothetical protein
VTENFNRRALAITVCLLFVNAIIGWFKNGTKPTEERADHHEPVAVSHLVERIQAPVKAPFHLTKAGPISEECLAEGQTLLGLDLNKFGHKGTGSNLSINLDEGQPFAYTLSSILPARKCTGLQDPVLKGMQEAFWSSCQSINGNDSPSEKWARSLQNCFVALLNFRMTFLDRITANIPLSEISDEEILTAKMLAAVFAPTKPDELAILARVSDIALRLLEVNANNLDAALYLASTKRRQLELNENPNARKELLAETARAVERLETIALDNWTSAAAQFNFAKTQQDFIKMDQIGTRLAKSNDNFTKAQGLYYLAWTRYEKGEREMAINLLKEAAAIDSGSSMAKESLDILTARTHSTEPPFIDVSSGFSGLSVAGPPY